MLQKNIKFLLVVTVCFVLKITCSHMYHGVDKKTPMKKNSTKRVSGYSIVKIAPERLHLFGITTEKVAYKKLTKRMTN